MENLRERLLNVWHATTVSYPPAKVQITRQRRIIVHHAIQPRIGSRLISTMTSWSVIAWIVMMASRRRARAPGTCLQRQPAKAVTSHLGGRESGLTIPPQSALVPRATTVATRLAKGQRISQAAMPAQIATFQPIGCESASTIRQSQVHV